MKESTPALLKTTSAKPTALDTCLWEVHNSNNSAITNKQPHATCQWVEAFVPIASRYNHLMVLNFRHCNESIWVL